MLNIYQTGMLMLASAVVLFLPYPLSDSSTRRIEDALTVTKWAAAAVFLAAAVYMFVLLGRVK